MHDPEVKFPQRFLRLVIRPPTFGKTHDQSGNLQGTRVRTQTSHAQSASTRQTASGADLTSATHKKAPEKPGLELGTFGRDRPLQPAPSRVNKPLTTISATKEIAPKTTVHNLAEYSAPACNLEATRLEKPNPLVEKVLGASWRPQPW
jgi:hypothetical protein